MGLALIALLVEKKGNFNLLKVLLAAGVGSLIFNYLQLLFFKTYPDNLLWSNFWEELTELLYVLGVVCLLWIFQPKTDAAANGQFAK